MATENTPAEPPNLDELLKVNTRSRDWLRNRIKHLRKQYPQLRERLSAKNLSRDIDGAMSASQIDDFLKSDFKPDENPHHALVLHLWNNKWCGMTWLKEGLAVHPGALFYSLCNFLDVNEQRSIELRREVVGTYRLWRAAMHVEGKYILGKLEIAVDPESGGVTAIETQVYKGCDKTAGQKEVFEGFIIKKSSYFLMFGKLAGHHKGAPRTTAFHNALYEGGLVVSLEGAVTGCYGSNDLFSAPIYAERVHDTEALDQQLDVYPESEVPDLVRSKLVFHIRSDGVIRF